MQRRRLRLTTLFSRLRWATTATIAAPLSPQLSIHPANHLPGLVGGQRPPRSPGRRTPPQVRADDGRAWGWGGRGGRSWVVRVVVRVVFIVMVCRGAHQQGAEVAGRWAGGGWWRWWWWRGCGGLLREERGGGGEVKEKSARASDLARGVRERARVLPHLWFAGLVGHGCRRWRRARGWGARSFGRAYARRARRAEKERVPVLSLSFLSPLISSLPIIPPTGRDKDDDMTT